MTKLNRGNWPSAPYECPYCFQNMNSMEALIDHFEKMGHPKKYIHHRFCVDLSRRKAKLYNATTYSNISVYKSPSVKHIAPTLKQISVNIKSKAYFAQPLPITSLSKMMTTRID